MNSSVPATIDEYMEGVPPVPRATLEKIRTAIRKAAPRATEVISYQIPTFKQEYALISFAAFKNHCSVFTLSNAVMDELADDLKAYDCKGVTIHFPLDKPFPTSLIKKIVAIRLMEDEVRATARAAKKKRS